MKTPRVRAYLMLAALSGAACGSESGSDPDSNGSEDPACLSGSIELTETKRTDSPSFNTVLLDFDAKNASSEDYDIMNGSKAILLDVVVTTTDGTEYDSQAPLTAAKIRAGATAAVVVMAGYGAGKVFESYTVSLRCR